MLIIDAKIIPAWNRSVFEQMRKGGLSAAHVVCSIWEDFEGSMRSMARLKACIAANSDLVYVVRCMSDLSLPCNEQRTGIILGWQNSSGFGDYLPYVDVFAELGLRIVQPAFLTANSAGSGCYESGDIGLTDFGREMVAKLNTCGIAIDISHLNSRTASDVVRTSVKPVFYAQAAPKALRDNVRNKTDEEMRTVADKGGVIAIAALPHYLPSGIESNIDDYARSIDYVRSVVGDEHVALGTDLTPEQPRSFYDYVSHDKGSGRQLIDYSVVPTLKGLTSPADYPCVVEALAALRVPPSTIDKIMGGNLLRYFDEVWAG